MPFAIGGRLADVAEVLHNVKTGAKIPLVKVLKVLRKIFQKFSKQGSGQSPEVLSLNKGEPI